MDKRTRSVAKMHHTVSLLVDDYEDVSSADADLTAAEQLRQIHLGRYREAARKAAVPIPTTTADKEAAKKRVIEEMMKPMGRVGAWASRNQNEILRAEMAVSFSTLDDLPDGEIVAELERLMALMRGVIAQVPTVPAARLDTLDDELDALEPKLGAPRKLIVDRSAADEEAKRELRAASKILDEQHDLLVREFKHTNPATPVQQRQREFFDRWAPARAIVDAPTDSDDEAPPAAAGSPAPSQP